MTNSPDVSSLTLNRLSVYLRCLRELSAQNQERISSKELAERFHLSAPQFRKDLAHFGEFGIRGVGYEVRRLEERLTELLGLDRVHSIVVVGMGNLGNALVLHGGFNRGAFRIVGAFDNDLKKVGTDVGGLSVRDIAEISDFVASEKIEIALLAVPAGVAQAMYDDLAAAGVHAVLNFAPVRLRRAEGVATKTVDLRIDLEELVFSLTRQ